ncbi:uncharacterized protein LOC122064521, partial [Macadamia integrifolia]|uniref:uncharacterized protein LOC122064521 n=1 Tax=Macadamia integrifolia TaxID=60698 RepID=UPI001C500171
MVKRILMDNGSSTDILFLEAFQKMGLGEEKLKRVEHPLQGFSRAPVKVEGSIELPVRDGTEDRQVTVMINFLVVDITSAYNAILERFGLNLLKAIVSTPHLKMKFSTKNGLASDIPGIAKEVIEHQLSVDPTKKPMQQKKRTFTPERQHKIEEVEKLLKAKFIREIQYPEWISNVVMVPK